MKTKEIRDLIDFISKSGLNEVKIETEELKISVKRDPEVKEASTVVQTSPAAAPVSSESVVPQAPSPAETAASEAESNYVEVKSPMIGTFYRSPNPESDPFIEVGDTIAAGQTVCIIEAMKLFNEIDSDISGKIVKILAEDASPVEYDQPLFLVDPS